MKQVMIEVSPELFASVRQSYILDRKGVVGYDWEDKDDMLISRPCTLISHPIKCVTISSTDEN